MLYLFGQLLGYRLDFVARRHGVRTPRRVEEDKRHLGHAPQTLHLVADGVVLLLERTHRHHHHLSTPSMCIINATVHPADTHTHIHIHPKVCVVNEQVVRGLGMLIKTIQLYSQVKSSQLYLYSP